MSFLIVFVLMSIWGEPCFSISTSGVPCYLQPPGDGCHYELKPGSEVCTSLPERKRLMQGVVVVNRTLVSLEQQLIRLGISKD